MMTLKYVRHDKAGFVLWPDSDDLWHVNVGDMLRNYVEGKVISAGFVSFKSGIAVCFGRSESLRIGSRPDDGDALTKQLELVPPNV